MRKQRRYRIFHPTNRLRVLRAERRLTQSDVALRLGFGSKFRYWQLENEEVAPTDRERRKLCKIFNVREEVIWPSRLLATGVA